MPQVAVGGINPAPAIDFAAFLANRFDPAELDASQTPSFLRVHPLRNMLPRLQLDVKV
jgi:hypothetical protein